jgi:hypothetical protein
MFEFSLEGRTGARRGDFKEASVVKVVEVVMIVTGRGVSGQQKYL